MPTLTWISDIVSVIESGFKPVFVDIDPLTLSMDNKWYLKKLQKLWQSSSLMLRV